jgi:hypothetical protein
MKIRDGFVSNSSSTSFTCQISGRALAGRDGEYEEGTCTCIKCGTDFLSHYALKVDIDQLSIAQKRDILSVMNESNYGGGAFENLEIDDPKQIINVTDDVITSTMIAVKQQIEDGYEHTDVHEVFCPCCNLTHIIDADVTDYLMAKCGFFTKDAVRDEIRSVFNSRETLQNFTKTMLRK